jgi:predicted PurR-regulated permease PerM
MDTALHTEPHPWTHPLLDVLLRVGVIAVLAVFCFGVFHPFLNLMLWSTILAVTLYPLHRWLRAKLGGKDGRAATLIVVAVLLVLAVPAWVVGNSLVDTAVDGLKKAHAEHLEIPAPRAEVRGWPLVGERVYAAWDAAHRDPEALKQKLGPKLLGAGKKLLATLGDLAGGLLLFVFAMPIAGIIMAYGEHGTASMRRIASAFVGPIRGPEIIALITATIRAVAQGVIGIAFIQAVLVGIGIVPMGVPAAGLLCLVVLMLGIMQLPATIITIPIIIYMFATEGSSATMIIFGIYLFVAGLADNVLKPLMLGRGVSVPMPVVLIGAIGGMITGGLLGLFIGPVALGVAYELFWRWVDERAPEATPVVPGPAVPAAAHAAAAPAV